MTYSAYLGHPSQLCSAEKVRLQGGRAAQCGFCSSVKPPNSLSPWRYFQYKNRSQSIREITAPYIF